MKSKLGASKAWQKASIFQHSKKRNLTTSNIEKSCKIGMEDSRLPVVTCQVFGFRTDTLSWCKKKSPCPRCTRPFYRFGMTIWTKPALGSEFSQGSQACGPPASSLTLPGGLRYTPKVDVVVDPCQLVVVGNRTLGTSGGTKDLWFQLVSTSETELQVTSYKTIRLSNIYR